MRVPAMLCPWGLVAFFLLSSCSSRPGGPPTPTSTAASFRSPSATLRRPDTPTPRMSRTPTVVPSAEATIRPHNTSLADILTSPDPSCILPCWHDLTLGESSVTELERIFAEIDVDRTTVKQSSTGWAAQFVFRGSNGHIDGYVFVTRQGTILEEVDLWGLTTANSGDLEVGLLKAHLGIPDRILYEPDPTWDLVFLDYRKANTLIRFRARRGGLDEVCFAKQSLLTDVFMFAPSLREQVLESETDLSFDWSVYSGESVEMILGTLADPQGCMPRPS